MVEIGGLELATPDEVAKLLGVCTETVLRYSRLPVNDPRRLPAIRRATKVYFDLRDVRTWLEEGKEA